MKEVVWALSAVAAATIALFLALHWRRARDRFFLYFGGAFLALAASSIVLLTSTVDSEARPAAYVIRLLAFLLIIVAIVDKNRAEPEPIVASEYEDDWAG
jgi:hypothetical protein